MTVCHARYCDERAELRLFVGNNHSYKNRWAGGLDYCQPHAEKVGLSMADRGLRVLIEELGRVGEVVIRRMYDQHLAAKVIEDPQPVCGGCGKRPNEAGSCCYPEPCWEAMASGLEGSDA